MKLVLLKCKQSILAREPILWLNIMLTSLTPSSTGSFNQAVLSLANIACRFAFSSQGKYFFAMARRDLKNYKIFYQSGFRNFLSLALFKQNYRWAIWFDLKQSVYMKLKYEALETNVAAPLIFTLAWFNHLFQNNLAVFKWARAFGAFIKASFDSRLKEKRIS